MYSRLHIPTNSLGSAEGPIVADLSNLCMIDFDEKHMIESGDIIILTNCFGHLVRHRFS